MWQCPSEGNTTPWAFFKKMTTITTAIVSKIEATEIHPDRSRWSEALSEWNGPAVELRDVTDEINMPLELSEEAGTISVTFCPWIVTHSENWMVQRRRHVVMATERDGHLGTRKWKLPSSTPGNSDVCSRWFLPQNRLGSRQMKS